MPGPGKSLPQSCELACNVTIDTIDWSASTAPVKAKLKQLRLRDDMLRRTWWCKRQDLPDKGFVYDLSLVKQLVDWGWTDPTELATALKLFHALHCRSEKSRSRAYIARTIAKALEDG